MSFSRILAPVVYLVAIDSDTYLEVRSPRKFGLTSKAYATGFRSRRLARAYAGLCNGKVVPKRVNPS